MVDSLFTFTVEVRRGGQLLGAAVASLAPCVEDALFRGVLNGGLPNDGTVPAFTVAPVWAAPGPPAVAGVTLAHAGEPAGEYGLGPFAAKARAIIQDLLRRKVLKVGAHVEWSVIAAEQPPAPPPRFRARASRAPYPFEMGHLPKVTPGSFAVSVEPCVLRAIRKAVVTCFTAERAGLLVGSLVYDRDRAAAALAVTGQIPLAPAAGGASNIHFSLGPDSFRAAKKTLAEVANGASAVGWWHSHPPCAQCPMNPDCAADTVFFSPDDVQVHASAFSAAYMVALVAGKVRDRPAFDPGLRLYSWKDGAIIKRRLRVLEGSERCRAHAAPSTQLEAPG
ncbi:MAG: hypothetical protein ACE5I7_14890 [Candidatus Binatia bacterium]